MLEIFISTVTLKDLSVYCKEKICTFEERRNESMIVKS